jgi:hypothetical protein
MKKRYAALLALSSLPLALATGTPASASTSEPVLNITTQRAQVLSLDAVSLGTDGVATVTFTYSCVGSPFTLWISLKQPRDTSAPEGPELSSSASAAWDSLHTQLACSPKPQPQQATIHVDDEYAPYGDFGVSGALQAGARTYIQLCLTASPAAAAAYGQGDEPRSSAGKADKLALQYNWVTLTAA